MFSSRLESTIATVAALVITAILTSFSPIVASGDRYTSYRWNAAPSVAGVHDTSIVLRCGTAETIPTAAGVSSTVILSSPTSHTGADPL